MVMEFLRYDDLDKYKTDVFNILLEDEVLNNLPISIVSGSNVRSGDKVTDDWLLSVIKNDRGAVVLVAICTKPFNMLLYVPAAIRSDSNQSGDDQTGEAIKQLASELKTIGFTPPGVLAPADIAYGFADAYCSGGVGGVGGVGGGVVAKKIMTLILMKLDKLAGYTAAPGAWRLLKEDDISFVPHWEHQFCIDCNLPLYTQAENEARIRTRLDRKTHFIWEDGQPVAQAAFGRETPNSAVISWVYTPAEFRGRGYATSVVAEVSKSIFARGKHSCCLFADASNPASCAVYHKLGYYDVCTFEEIKFDTAD